jgi:hypothetical protein
LADGAPLKSKIVQQNARQQSSDKSACGKLQELTELLFFMSGSL